MLFITKGSRMNWKIKIKAQILLPPAQGELFLCLEAPLRLWLGLKGLANRKRALEYLEALLKSLATYRLSDKEAERLRVILGRALRDMESPSKSKVKTKF